VIKVLIVDDDPRGTELLVQRLDGQGFELSAAGSGAEALQIAAAECPDVILLDVMMPEMDGIEVCRRLKASAELRMIPVILVTAMDRDEDVVRGLDAGAADYVTKPINLVLLVARLRSAMRLRSSYAALARMNDCLQAEIVERQNAERLLLRRNTLLGAMNQVFEKALACESDGDVIRAGLLVAQELTGSPLGYVGELSDPGHYEIRVMSVPDWQAGSLATRKVATVNRDMAIRGIWGKVLEEGRSVLTNEPASHPDCAGIPPGHWPITALLAVPLKRDGQTIGMIALANKEAGYDASDQEMMESLAVAFVEALMRKRAEETLREREERFRNIVQNASEVIYTLSPDGIVTFISPAWTTTLGWDVAAIEGKSYLPLVHPDDLAECRSFVQRVLATGTAEKGLCYRIRHKDGSWRWATAALSVVKDKQGNPLYCVGVGEDITERKRVGEELRKKEEELRQSQKLEAVGLLAGGIAHEFNNLLQAIGGYAECAREGLTPREQRYQDLQQIIKAADRAAMLTRQLLGFSRRCVLQPRNVDPNSVVTDLAKLLRPLIGERIVLTLVLTENAAAVFGDPGELQQVLLNLCLNARDAMPEGGQLVIKTDLVMLSEPFSDPRFRIRPGRHVVFGVTDTGCGISPEVQQHIFEPFFTTKELGKGTGLGLAMVYGLVQQHQGAIHVYSEPGKGTSFKLYLPAVARSTPGKPVEGPPRVAGGKETILVAEDDPLVRRLAVRILTAAGYQVLTASDGAEALRVFAEHRQDISLVVMDAIMPKLTGHEVYRRIKAQHPSARVIFVSGYDRETGQSQPLFRENLRLVEKPFDADTLLRSVREALDEEVECLAATTTA
jgi:PAS domain S-box-containing protein